MCFVFLVVCFFFSVHPLISILVWRPSSAPEITPLERQAGRQRLRQQTHQTGRQGHHPGDLLPVACPQSPGRDLRVRVHLLSLRAFQSDPIMPVTQQQLNIASALLSTQNSNITHFCIADRNPMVIFSGRHNNCFRFHLFSAFCSH